MRNWNDPPPGRQFPVAAGDRPGLSSATVKQNPEDEPLSRARDEFVTQWGAMGSAWGINRTMAQIHALLLASSKSLSTDEIMAELRISRGNANTNLRDLVGWGLVRSVIRKGERKEFFEAEKDVWKIFCTIARERKRREVSPAMEVLRKCVEETRAVPGEEAREFHQRMTELLKFMQLGERILERVAGSDQSKMLKFAARFLG